ncbi:BON domain-containing protein [Chromobacterium vaccinii]|uniref:BON domain-containing protein n=1 Tax=Chromobacterium vaccinii TaxID=1108595 RepID=UPI000618328F|nr:BON domain-containing protein [Chromobacterium vaccinii]QND85086.1 Uncharacterized protein ChrSW_2860 [Chromobacterium vaccinii]QND90317.1 Uncharacterized protein ChrSV_2860 [Chromobacterium vaccinii]
MKLSSRNLALSAAIPLAIIVGCGQARADARSQEVLDARQEAQIATIYALNPYLRHNNLKVVVAQGTATLSGNVEDDVNRDLAKEIALGVSGVTRVENQIVIQSNQDPQASAYTGEAIDDSTITASIKSKLYWSQRTERLPITVKTERGHVVLRGTADSLSSRNFAGQLALSTRGVESVDNQLQVNGKTSAAAIDDTQESVRTELSDSWITTKVKSTFLYSNNVAGSNIAVSTLHGVVTLRGMVETGAERALAIELAQNVRGVKSVKAANLVFSATDQ